MLYRHKELPALIREVSVCYGTVVNVETLFTKNRKKKDDCESSLKHIIYTTHSKTWETLQKRGKKFVRDTKMPFSEFSASTVIINSHLLKLFLLGTKTNPISNQSSKWEELRGPIPFPDRF